MAQEVKTVKLRAFSPRSAFYCLTIIHDNDFYCVCKESGGNDRVLDRRIWLVKTIKDAERLFTRKLQSKTNPARKSRRKYIIDPAGQLQMPENKVKGDS